MSPSALLQKEALQLSKKQEALQNDALDVARLQGETITWFTFITSFFIPFGAFASVRLPGALYVYVKSTRESKLADIVLKIFSIMISARRIKRAGFHPIGNFGPAPDLLYSP